MRKLVLLFLCLSTLLIGCGKSAAPDSEANASMEKESDSTSSANTSTESDGLDPDSDLAAVLNLKKNNPLYKMTPEKYEAAIHQGEQSDADEMGALYDAYALPVAQNNLANPKEKPAKVILRTFYLKVVEASYLTAQQSRTLNLEKAQAIPRVSGINVSIIVQGDETMPLAYDYKVKLQQGDRVYEPYKYENSGDKQLAEDPFSTTYYYSIMGPPEGNSKMLDALFLGLKGLDFKQPAKLILSYSGEEDHVVYELDFSKYK